VLFFDVAPHAVASRDIRARLALGEPLDGLVPGSVARIIHERRLYVDD
jgi:nicotinic acid mononucleotide adenylyltransferase